MLSFNRTFITTMFCLLAMLLTGLASGVRAATAPIEVSSSKDRTAELHQQMGVDNTDCIESHHGGHLMEKGQQVHTSCSSSCIVKIPTNLLQDDVILLPHSLALIDKSSTPKAVTVVDRPYRPPIV
ncbi:hypothetical protein [Vibrio rotiferianus]|uniref:hypothetical protein n=1 Tax=Vibrio rotiferianus TaxID=190895 RepID=UPI00148CD9B1|nr:hypothetical protein [Vibrio rotiferianus]NOH66506.1 hypothetical protein [Vibrio rotiferianus]